MTVLFDGNVLVAITFPAHVHHDAVHAWWTSAPRSPGTPSRPVPR